MKIIKKDLRKTALKLLPAVYNAAMRTGEEDGLFKHEDWRTGLCLDAFLLAEAFEKAAAYRNTEPEPEPQLKQIDQSVFKEWADCWKFAAVDLDGESWVYRERPKIDKGDDRWLSSNTPPNSIGTGYDPTDWQNSLIERESSELTGSDLARAMLARGDKYVSGFGHHQSDDGAVYSTFADTVTRYNHCFHSAQNSWDYFVPINNQGEPLTAAEAGL